MIGKRGWSGFPVRRATQESLALALGFNSFNESKYSHVTDGPNMFRTMDVVKWGSNTKYRKGSQGATRKSIAVLFAVE